MALTVLIKCSGLAFLILALRTSASDLSPQPPSPLPPSPTAAANFSSVWDVVQNTTSLYYVAQALLLSGQYIAFANPALSATIFLPTNESFIKLTTSLGLGTEPLKLTPYFPSLTKALQYHVLADRVRLADVVAQVGTQGGTTYYDTGITSGPYGRLGLRVAPRGSPSDTAAITALATSTEANVLQADIAAGASYVNIVDTILQYWYSSVEKALSAANGTSIFFSALQASGLIPLLSASNASYTLFMPTDAALIAAGYNSNVTLSSDVVRAHVVASVLWADLMSPNRTATALGGQLVTLTIPSVNDTKFNGARPSVSATLTNTPLATIIDTLQVGIGPAVLIHVVDKVLIPVYTTAWQYLINTAGFESFRVLLQAEGSTLPTLQDPKSRITLLAPNNQAMAALVKRFGGQTNLSLALDRASLQAMVRSHVVTSPLPYESMSRNQTLDTLSALASIRTTSVNGILTISADLSTARIVAPYNVSIMYGRTYVHALDPVLLPDTGRGAAAAAPSSLLLLLAGLLAARLATQLMPA